MNNDEIFRNEHPHEVVMPEGSHIAVSKTAEKTEPSIRKVFQEGEEFIDAHVILEEGAITNLRTAEETVALATNETRHSGPSQQTDRIDNQKAEATLLRESAPISAFNEPDLVNTPVTSLETIISSELPTNIEIRADTQEIRKTSDASKAPVEMDFPARVINLKIENDQLHERLDLLEQRNMP
jgi:hypothetical protein